MLPRSYLIPAHSLPVPEEMQGTRGALFFLLRRVQPAAPVPQGGHPLPIADADHFIFQS